MWPNVGLKRHALQTAPPDLIERVESLGSSLGLGWQCGKLSCHWQQVLTSIGNHYIYWTTQPSPFDFRGSSCQLISSAQPLYDTFDKSVMKRVMHSRSTVEEYRLLYCISCSPYRENPILAKTISVRSTVESSIVQLYHLTGS